MFILTEANLGILGLGVAEPLPSWGSLLRELESFSTARLSRGNLFPCFFILVVSSFHLALQQRSCARRKSVLRSSFVAILVSPSHWPRPEASCVSAFGTKDLQPVLIEDDSSDTIRYLTGGVLSG